MTDNINKEQTLKEDLIVRGIKMLDIGYITTIYVFGGLYGATFLDNYIYPYISLNKNIPIKEKTDFQLIIDTIIFLIINAIAAYILRNLLQKIPFPLEGKYGFKHMKVREVSSGQIINFIILIFSRTIRYYILELQYRIEKKIKKKNDRMIYNNTTHNINDDFSMFI